MPEMLKGIALANPGTIKYVPEYNLIMRTDAPRDDKVSIIQGSGSGHEPAHVMVVGPGMLDAACPGDVFAAPPMDYVLETSKLLNSPKGVLHIINNYTGDRMAFDMGREMAEAEGVQIAHRHRRRRRRREGLDVHRRPARRGGELLRDQGARRRLRAGRRPRRPRRARRAGELRVAHDGHGAHVVHAAREGLAAVRPRRRRDGDGRRHPRRAGPAAGEAGVRRRDRGRAARGGRVRPAVREGRRRRADDQWPGRHADQRAVHPLRARARAARVARHQREAQLRRRVLHLARHGRRLAHPGPAWTTSWTACSAPPPRSRSGPSSRIPRALAVVRRRAPRVQGDVRVGELRRGQRPPGSG